MYTLNLPGFDLELTAQSGQCFRFDKIGDSFSLIAQNRHLIIDPISLGKYRFHCSEAEFESIWRPYFDLDYDYRAIGRMITKDCEYLARAYAYAGGLRILRQDPFETLISFILSQRKSIPAIQSCVRALSERFGKPIDENNFAFPEPETLACANVEDLLKCAIGYRAPYVLESSRMIAEGKINLDALNQVGDEELLNQLMRFHGVGIKVANCVMLFAYHRMNAFPIDVWIERVLDQEYPSGFPFERFEGVSGLIQQYLFCYIRYQNVTQPL